MIIFEIIFLAFALIFALILDIFEGIVSFIRWDWKRK